MKRILVTVAAACMAAGVASAAAAAPPLPATITLAGALALLRDVSPRTRAERSRIDVVAAERVTAGTWPNPTLSYGGSALADGSNTGAQWQHQIMIEQPLLLFGQAGAREDVADLDVETERARVADDLAQRALAVRQAFAALVADQERVQVLQECLAELARIEEIVRGRQAAGDRSVYDVTRLEIEASTEQSELQIAQADVEDASGQLASALGLPGWQPRAQGDLELRNISTDMDLLWAAAQRGRPSIAVVKAERAAARRELTLARREGLPVPAIAIGTLLTRNADSASVLFGVSLPLPLFDRNQGAVARASAAIEAGDGSERAELAETRAELERARNAYLHQREILGSIEQQQVAKIPALEKMAEEAYQGGNADILDVLDALRSVKAIRLAHLERREAVKLAEESLIAIAALEPAVPSKSGSPARPERAGQP